MPIPDSIRTAAEAHLDRYCVGLIPKHAHDKVRIGYIAQGIGHHALRAKAPLEEQNRLDEVRRGQGQAQQGRRSLDVYCRDQHGKWHSYEPLPPTPDFGAVLREIKADPTGIFGAEGRLEGLG